MRISVTKEKDLQPAETDCILTDDAGNPIALLGNSTNEMNETERIQALYPGQPEEEDTSDETMPAASDFSGPGSSDKVLSDEGIAVVIFDADVSTWNDAEKTRLIALKKKGDHGVGSSDLFSN